MENISLANLQFQEALDYIYSKELDCNTEKYDDTSNGFVVVNITSTKNQFLYRKNILFWILNKYYETSISFNVENHSSQTLDAKSKLYIQLQSTLSQESEISNIAYQTVSTIDWSKYRNLDNNKILYKYIIDHFIHKIPEEYHYVSETLNSQWNFDLACSSILESVNFFDKTLENKNILLKVCSFRFLEYFLSNINKCKSLIICDSNSELDFYLNLLSLYYADLNLTLIDYDSDFIKEYRYESFFDLAILSDKDTTLFELLPIIKQEGYCIIGNQTCNVEQITELFDNLKLHVICEYERDIDINDHCIFFIQKIKDTNQHIGFLKSYEDYTFYDEKKHMSLIKEEYKKLLCGENQNLEKYQVLNKEDFIYSTNSIFSKDIFRNSDEIDFKWFKISDIFKEEKDQDYFSTTLLSNEDVVSSPERTDFKYDLPAKYYLKNGTDFGTEEIDIEKYRNSLFIQRDAEGEPSLYGDIERAYRIWGPENQELDIEDKKYKQVTTQRMLNKPVYLAYNYNFFKINASSENLVPYERWYIQFDEFHRIELLDDLWVPYTINEEFHDYCTMYLMHRHHKSVNSNGYILLPKTREEQQKYFYKKQFEYFISHPEEISIQHSNKPLNTYSNQIGFNNFRKFKELVPINLKDITILVGGNNSGKSTLVKGVILLLDNLKDMSNSKHGIFKAHTPMFRFDANGIHDVNISLFSRALYNQAASETITFNTSIACFDIKIQVEGNKNKQQTAVPVSLIDIVDKFQKLHFIFDFRHNTMSVSTDEKTYTNKQLAFCINEVNNSILVEYIKAFNEKSIVNDDTTGILAENYLKIYNSALQLQKVIQNISIEYIYAHAATQNILYNTADKNDYMAQTIHRFVSQNISQDSDEYQFILYWMNKLEIGVDFAIQNIAGEAYTLKVVSQSKNEEYLADKGIGSNQMMILLLKIATIVNKFSTNIIKPIIVIEEPEQNLHPALQSSLADLFYDANQRFGLKFIIETHSEYLVRKTQVVVSKTYNTTELLQKNPFVVYYFPSTEQPYNMTYTTSGRFDEKFGEGFYDAAGALHLQLPRIERRK